jgi:hypothetical protein
MGSPLEIKLPNRRLFGHVTRFPISMSALAITRQMKF